MFDAFPLVSTVISESLLQLTLRLAKLLKSSRRVGRSLGQHRALIWDVSSRSCQQLKRDTETTTKITMLYYGYDLKKTPQEGNKQSAERRSDQSLGGVLASSSVAAMHPSIPWNGIFHVSI